MSTIVKIKDYLSKIKNRCENKNVTIVDYKFDDYECYITFEYQKDNMYINNLFTLRENEYIYTIDKTDDSIFITISGDNKLYESIADIDDDNQIINKDIDEIIKLMKRIEDLNKVTLYYNGISYIYEIDNNKYDFAFDYYNFGYNASRHLYRVSNISSFYDVMSGLNRSLSLYKTKMYNDIGDKYTYDKDVYLTEIRDILENKNSKKIYIVFYDGDYYLIINIGSKEYKYRYDNINYFKNIVPEILEMYCSCIGSKYEEERSSCMDRGFYINRDKENELAFYNVYDNELDTFLSYMNGLLNRFKLNDGKKIIERDNSGYVSTFLLLIGVLLLGIFTVIITLNILK